MLEQTLRQSLSGDRENFSGKLLVILSCLLLIAWSLNNNTKIEYFDFIQTSLTEVL